MAEVRQPSTHSRAIPEDLVTGDPTLQRLYKRWADKDPDFPALLRSSRMVHRLRLARKRSGITQVQVAARLGSQQSAVARFERGEGDPRLSTVERYADLLGLRLALIDHDGHVVEDPELHIDELTR